jgi:hypothetical protein
MLLVACAHGDSEQRRTFDAVFSRAVPTCEEFFLPNSMARPPGFDLKGHTKELEQRLAGFAHLFQSEAGRAYLDERAKRESDNVAKGCAEQLLVRAGAV